MGRLGRWSDVTESCVRSPGTAAAVSADSASAICGAARRDQGVLRRDGTNSVGGIWRLGGARGQRAAARVRGGWESRAPPPPQPCSHSSHRPRATLCRAHPAAWPSTARHPRPPRARARHSPPFPPRHPPRLPPVPPQPGMPWTSARRQRCRRPAPPLPAPPLRWAVGQWACAPAAFDAAQAPAQWWRRRARPRGNSPARPLLPSSAWPLPRTPAFGRPPPARPPPQWPPPQQQRLPLRLRLPPAGPRPLARPRPAWPLRSTWTEQCRASLI